NIRVILKVFKVKMEFLLEPTSNKLFVDVPVMRTSKHDYDSSAVDFLSTIPSYTLIRDPLRRLCHRLIAFSIAGRGQTTEKVTTTDLFYLRSMDERAMVNVPYLLAYYLFRHASGRKQGAKMSRGHLLDIDCGGDVVTWVAMGLERQHAGAVVGAAHVDLEVA
ncbi:hypothetical protein Tco_0091583, partial [Tanacetum coccineum]